MCSVVLCVLVGEVKRVFSLLASKRCRFGGGRGVLGAEYGLLKVQ